MVVPVVEVSVGLQWDIGLVDEAAAATDAGGTGKLVVLEEHKDVLLIDFDDSNLHGAQVHGPEREHEIALVRKDVAAHGDGDGGLFLVLLPDAGVILSKGISVGVFDAFVNSEGKVSFTALEVYLHKGVLYLDIAPGNALELYHAALGGVGRGLAEKEFYAGVLKLSAPDTEAFTHVYGFFHGFGGLSHGKAKVKALGAFLEYLVQGKACAIALTGLQRVRSW